MSRLLNRTNIDVSIKLKDFLVMFNLKHFFTVNILSDFGGVHLESGTNSEKAAWIDWTSHIIFMAIL